MAPEKIKKKIWHYFWRTLLLAVGLSLLWEFVMEGLIKPIALSFFSSPQSDTPWFDSLVHVGIVIGAMLINLPSLMGGVQATGKKTVSDLGMTERRYKSIVDSTNDLIFQLDAHGIVVFANPAMRLLGYEDGEMIGQFVGDFLYMDNKDEVLPQIMTKRVGHRATYSLPVELRTSPECVISSEIPAMAFVMDACGLWEESDDQVQTRGAEKNFIGTLCIARPVITPESLEPREESKAV